MYKVVTHTITEEHFNHPVTANIGMSIHRGNIKHGNTMPKISSTYSAMSIVPRIVDQTQEMYYGTCPVNGNANIKVKLPSEWGSYDAFGDLNLYGDLCISGDLTVDGTINSKNAGPSIGTLETDLTSNVAVGNKGDMAVSSKFVYLCIEQDTWVRWPIQSTW